MSWGVESPLQNSHQIVLRGVGGGGGSNQTVANRADPYLHPTSKIHNPPRTSREGGW